MKDTNDMQTLILVVHVLTAFTIIGLVLIQHGKGADMGAAFGGGASGSLFGSTGSANFLSRITAIAAAVFFATSLTLTWFSAHGSQEEGVMSSRPVTQTPATNVPVPASTTTLPAPTVPDDGSRAKDIPK